MRRVRDEHGLSLSEQKFVEVYLRTMDGLAAAKAAGNSVTPTRYLERKHVQARLHSLAGQAIEDARIGAAAVIQRLFQRALYDVRELVHETGVPKSVNELPEYLAGIVEIESKAKRVREEDGTVTTTAETVLKSPDRGEALTNLVRLLRLSEPDVLKLAEPVRVLITKQEEGL